MITYLDLAERAYGLLAREQRHEREVVVLRVKIVDGHVLAAADARHVLDARRRRYHELESVAVLGHDSIERDLVHGTLKVDVDLMLEGGAELVAALLGQRPEAHRRR